MRNYVKPIVLANDELSEGVYAASGDCWRIEVANEQPDAGSEHVFEMRIIHSDTLQHLSSSTTVYLTFNYPITSARGESTAHYDVNYSGNLVTVTRNHNGNSYMSGDTVTFKVWVSAGDAVATEALTITKKEVVCAKTVNVQGNGGNE